MGNYWKAAVATAILALLAAPAAAADLRVAPGEELSPPADWTRPYVGLETGYGRGNFSFDNVGVVDGSSQGGLGGIEAGANFQTGQFVLGVEGDIAWTGMRSDITDMTVYGGTADLNWLGTLTGRAGFAADRALFYVEAGGAYGQMRLKGDSAGGPFDEIDGAAGWVAGAGIEYLLADHVTAKIEYNYVDLGGSSDWFGDDFNVTANIVKAGVNFQF